MRATSAPRSRARVVIPVAAAIVLVALGIAALVARDRNERAPEGGRATSYAVTIAGVCQAAREAAANDRVAASNTFYDQSHRTLHLLAERAEAKDRVTAARLLETKERVEQDLNVGGATLPADLRTLADRARTAIQLVGEPVPPGCTE